MKPRPNPIGPGQESVWDYPRPPIAERCLARIVIEHAGMTIADTSASVRTLETSHPPTYYIPPNDIAPDVLRRASGGSFCEWKGAAVYWDVVTGSAILWRIGWSYPMPSRDFEILRGYVAFYATYLDRCTVDGEVVSPQPGEFYGGWVTRNVVGPFKGVAGSQGW